MAGENRRVQFSVRLKPSDKEAFNDAAEKCVA